VLCARAVDRGTFFARRIHQAFKDRDEQQLIRLFLNFRHQEHIKVRARGRRPGGACASAHGWPRFAQRECTQGILSNFVDPLGLAIDLTEELEDELVMPSVDDVKRKYYWLYNEPLETALMAATAGSGAFGQLLLAMSTAPRPPRRPCPPAGAHGHGSLPLQCPPCLLVQNPAERDAAVFREACKDFERNTHRIMELLITRSPKEREGACTGARAPPHALPLWRTDAVPRCVRGRLVARAGRSHRQAVLRLVRPDDGGRDPRCLQVGLPQDPPQAR